MTLPEKIGIESHLLEFLPGQPAVRASFKIVKQAGNDFPEGGWLKVRVVARVYDLDAVLQLGTVPDVPLAEGPEVESTARLADSVETLPLPAIHFAEHAVVAKVYSGDERYPKLFDPSLCYVGRVRYGDFLRMKVDDLWDVYAGFGNAFAEEEIKRLVRKGSVVAVNHDGGFLAARDVNGKLDLQPLS